MSSILKALQRVEAEEHPPDGSAPPIDSGFVAQPGEPLRRSTPRWVIPTAAVCLGVGLIALLARWMVPVGEPADVGSTPGSGPVASAPVVPGPESVATPPVMPGPESVATPPIAQGPEPVPTGTARPAPVAKAPPRLPPGVPRTLPADPEATLELSPIPLPRKPATSGEREAVAARALEPRTEASTATPVTARPAPLAVAPPPEPTAVVASRPPVEPEPAPAAEVAAPPPAPAVAPKPAPARRATPTAPSVVVERTIWHPTAERREATVRVEGFPDAIQLREGDAVGVLVVTKIEPSAVVFLHGSRELRRKVGAR